MSIWLVGAAVVIAAAGWFGLGAYRRIDAWGRKMNEIDTIFRIADGETGNSFTLEAQSTLPGTSSSVATLGVPHAAAGLRH